MGWPSKKSKTAKRRFWPKSLFTQQLAQESIRGENLEFFQMKPPLKLFSMGTFSGPNKLVNSTQPGQKFLPGLTRKNPGQRQI